MDKKIELVDVKYEPKSDVKRRMDEVIKMLLSKVEGADLIGKQQCFVLLAILFYIMMLSNLMKLITSLF